MEKDTLLFIVQAATGVLILLALFAAIRRLRDQVDLLRNLVRRLETAAAEHTLLLSSLHSKVMVTSATATRIEDAAAVVAEDLKAAHGRADAANGPEGAAADAASRSEQ